MYFTYVIEDMTGIIMTVGPATNSESQLIRCYKNGIRILRFNFPHYNKESLKKDLQTIHKVEKKLKEKFSLLIDTE